MYLYVKALHIIFIVTWFSGMFYIVRLFIYNTEAQSQPEAERVVLTRQFSLMIGRLWLGITWPSAILTLVFGIWLASFFNPIPAWLWIKLGFVIALYAYHFSLQKIYRQQAAGTFRYSSGALRIWNEAATLFLVSIVMLVTVKQNMSWLWGITGLVGFAVILMIAIRIYKRFRART
jgi:putative membrane protein